MTFSSFYGLVFTIITMSVNFSPSHAQITDQSNISSCYYCNNCSQPTTNVSMQCSPNAVYCYMVQDSFGLYYQGCAYVNSLNQSYYPYILECGLDLCNGYAISPPLKGFGDIAINSAVLVVCHNKFIPFIMIFSSIYQYFKH